MIERLGYTTTNILAFLSQIFEDDVPIVGRLIHQFVISFEFYLVLKALIKMKNMRKILHSGYNLRRALACVDVEVVIIY